MNIYDWKNAPNWAMWATRDSNGFAHWHELEPRRTDNAEYGDYGVEWGSAGQKSWDCDPFWNQDCPEAQDSKEKRPEYQSKLSEPLRKWNWPAIAINSLIVFCFLFVIWATVIG